MAFRVWSLFLFCWLFFQPVVDVRTVVPVAVVFPLVAADADVGNSGEEPEGLGHRTTL